MKNVLTLIFVLIAVAINAQQNIDLFEKNRAQYSVTPVSFNSPGMDFSPFPYKQGFVFVSSRHERGLPGNGDQEKILRLYYSEENEDGSFKVPVLFNKQSTSQFHEGPSVFFENEKALIVTRNASFKKGKVKDNFTNTLQLAISKFGATNEWSAMTPLHISSNEYSIAHPSVSSDGKTLYFSSDMPGTIGKSDLYVSTYLEGAWSKPENLGDIINTPGQELFPYIHNDSILYFASNGHSGLGGLDIFTCNLRSAELKVLNIGAPINGDSDDFGIFIEADGTSGFFSSNRPGGFGEDDIYHFEEVHQFAEVQLYDSLTRQVVNNAEITLNRDNQIIGKTESDLTGTAEFRVSVLRNYLLLVSHEQYKPFNVHLAPSLWPPDKQAHLKIYLTPVTVNQQAQQDARAYTKRSSLTNTISFDSKKSDAEVEEYTKTDPVSEPTTDSWLAPIKVIVIENVNNHPDILLLKDKLIYSLSPISNSIFGNDELNLKLNFPQGSSRSDYQRLISEQVNAAGYLIRQFLLIKSFFFDYEKAWIRNDASAQLDKIIDVMITYPQIDVQLTFHSDSRGTESFNMQLSKHRAEEVKTYLTKAGIKEDRIITQFVGESKLLNDCGDLADCDELLHQTNRTTEFKLIISKRQLQ